MSIKVKSSEVVYDDLQVGALIIKKGASAPTERTYAYGIGGGIAFPVFGFALNNYVWFDIQTTHSMKLSTALSAHIHFTLPDTVDTGDKFKFQLDVIAAPINGSWAVPSGSPYSAEHTVATDDNTKHRILTIADIAAINTTVSTLYKCKLTRIAASADEYAGEVYVDFIDCHFQKDSHGSFQLTSKF